MTIDNGAMRADLVAVEAALRSERATLIERIDARLHQHGLERHAEAALPKRSEDTDDDAVASAQRDTDAAQLALAAGRLEQVERALQRMHERRFGTCVDCGDAILLERLRANPVAERCTGCASRHEKTGGASAALGRKI